MAGFPLAAVLSWAFDVGPTAESDVREDHQVSGGATVATKELAFRVAVAIAYSPHDRWVVPVAPERRVFTYIYLGLFEEALAEIEALLILEYYGALSVGTLRHDPRFDPLRDDPRLQRLVEAAF